MTPQTHDGQTPRPHRRGPSSYINIHADSVFAALAPKPGSVFLDMGCGPGDYALHAARLVGPGGTVHAVDRSETMLDGLAKDAREAGLSTVRTLVHDITTPLPLESGSVDVCLLGTVLHVMADDEGKRKVLREAHRLLAPGGTLGVVQIAKHPTDFGPPLERRLSEQETEALARQCGFEPVETLDMGDFYLSVFRKA